MIWNYTECNNKDTEEANIAQYKLTGTFYADVEAVCKLMGIKVHPGMRPVLWEKEPPLFVNEEEGEDQKEEKEIEVVKFDKHRIDKNSLKALFYVLPGSQVKTLKF